MTYTTYKTTTQNAPAGISEPAWKDPVSGHDYKNDHERDNHLFDSHRAYHAKDDVKVLRNILHQLKELGGDYGFNPDYKTNPQGKMRCTMNSGRKRKTDKKAFSSRHNDRDFDSNPEHIAKDKSDKNVIWSWCGTEISFDKGELKYYEETFGVQLEHTNQNYIKSRHKERVVTMDEWRKKAMHAPEEQILQIGRMEQYPEVEVSLSCFEEYLTWLNKWNEEHGKPFFVLNWAMHQDEMGAPHFHLRRAWPCKDEETGLTTSNQTQALLKAGILPPDPEKKISKKNNPKMTFDKMCREKWIFIARSHDLEIEDTPKPRDEVGKTLEEFQKEKDLQRNRVYTLLSALTEKNIDVLEEISKWDELMPSIQNFKEWTKERCKDAQLTYRDEQLDKIVNQFVAAFVNSTNAIKDRYDSQIKEYDKALNGYTKQTANGKVRVFGANEICEMFENATPELLGKIARVLVEKGCKDVKEWMQTNPWYREIENGQKIEREFKRSNSIER